MSTAKKYENIINPTLSKYFEKLTSKVGTETCNVLPENCAVIYDGWSNVGTHYLPCHTSFIAANNERYKLVSFGFYSLECEMRQAAENHEQHPKVVLILYDKHFSKVAALIGDDCSCNKDLTKYV